MSLKNYHKKNIMLYAAFIMVFSFRLTAGEVVINNNADFRNAITNPANAPELTLNLLSGQFGFDSSHDSMVDTNINKIIFNPSVDSQFKGWNTPGTDINDSKHRLLTDTGLAGSFTLDFQLSAYNVTLQDFSILGNANTANEGRGGAIYTDRSLIISGSGEKNLAFNNNRAQSGSASAGSDTGGSGHGGALYAGTDLSIGQGKYIFSNNFAIGGNADGAGAASTNSGLGGAIYAGGNFNTDQTGLYLFQANSAIGGSAVNAGTSDNSGLGGAIYAAGDFTVSGSIFVGNKAGTQNIVNANSGLGGAIYHDAASGSYSFTVDAAVGRDVLFQGNIHRVEYNNSYAVVNAGENNSIYFGNTSTTAQTTNVVFNAASGSTIYMYDPLGSQASDLSLSVSKTGEGRWLLGGMSELASETNMTISAGMFELDKNAELRLTNSTTANFTINPGAIFRTTITGNNVSRLNIAGNINISPEARLSVAGLSALETGNTVFNNAIMAGTGSVAGSGSNFSINNALVNVSYIANGAAANYDLVVSDLKNISDVFSEVNPVFDILRLKSDTTAVMRNVFDEIYNTGIVDSEILTISKTMNGSTMLANSNALRTNVSSYRRAVRERANGLRLFSAALSGSDSGVASDEASASLVASENCGMGYMLWAGTGARWTRQSDRDGLTGYDYNPYHLSLGIDKAYDNLLFGLAAQYSRGDIKSRDNETTVVDSQDVIFGLYGSYNSNQLYINAGVQYAQGWNSATVNYQAFKEIMDSSFSSRFFGGNIEIGYDFELPGLLEITPYAGFNYGNFRRAAFSESGNSLLVRSFARSAWDLFELPAGMRLAKSYHKISDKSTTVFTPFMDLSYTRNLGREMSRGEVWMASVPDKVWTANGVNGGRDSFNLQLGLNALINHNLEAGASYDLELRRSYIDQRLNIGIGFGF